MYKNIVATIVVLMALVGGLLAFRGKHQGPGFSCRTEIELGQLEIDRIYSIPIEFHNSGGSALVIEQVIPSCGCMKLSVDGHSFDPVQGKLDIPPGATATMQVDVSVRGEVPVVRQDVIRMKTNDPAHAAAAVELRYSVRGRLVASVRSVHIPSMLAGETRSGTIHLFDTTQDKSLTFGKVRASNSGAVRVVRLAQDASGTDQPDRASIPSNAKHVASFAYEITSGSKTGERREQLDVYEEGATNPTLTIPLTWTVRNTFEFSPQELSLPLNTSAGPSYVGRAIFRAADGTSYRLEIVEIPMGWEVTVSGDPGFTAAPRIVSIRGQPPKLTGGRSTLEIVTLRFRAVTESNSTAIELPVVCAAAE